MNLRPGKIRFQKMNQLGAGEMVYWLKVPVAKPNSLSSSLMSIVVEKELTSESCPLTSTFSL